MLNNVLQAFLRELDKIPLMPSGRYPVGALNRASRYHQRRFHSLGSEPKRVGHKLEGYIEHPQGETAAGVFEIKRFQHLQND